MEDAKTEILAAVKTLAGIEGTEIDGLLSLLIDDTVNAVLSYCRIEVLPRQLVSLIPVIVTEKYRLNKNDGVKALTEGERRVEYCDGDYDFLAAYAARLKPFVSRSVKVPSDLDAEVENNDESV